MDVFRPFEASASREQIPGVRVPSGQRLQRRAITHLALDGLGFGGLGLDAVSADGLAALDGCMPVDAQRLGNRVPRLAIASESANGGVLRSRPFDRRGHLPGSLGAGLHEVLGAFDDGERYARAIPQAGDEPAIAHGQNPEPGLAKCLLSGEKIGHFVEDELAGGDHVGEGDEKIRPGQANLRHVGKISYVTSDIESEGEIVEKSNMPNSMSPIRWSKLRAVMESRDVNANQLSLGINRHRTFINDLFAGRKKDVSAENLRRIAGYLSVSVSDITDDVSSEEMPLQPHGEVSIVGVLSQSGAVSPMPDGSMFPMTVVAPLAIIAGMVALLVIDDTMAPYIRKGAAVFFSESGDNDDPDGDAHIIETSDGRRLLRYVTAQPNGLFTLIGSSGLPEINVPLVSRARVAWIKSKAGLA